MNQSRRDSTYVVGLDPSMGTGGDNAAIQVWSLPEMNKLQNGCTIKQICADKLEYYMRC